ncbi:choloylglycine hydrolase family protein (plasmid) [Desulfobaculum bizertense]|uniref:linear amide C-N hydrolase n=1 Tax=Desulfobaculum bizertense TaxID=376490 RepID=UPI001F3B152B|nr:choloylglycine hydrolase family protein [Desulfobaculum bizertense]UIJ39556.1 choloylglycine hydrolase family protein [Desulfobaculum bizertense]
MFKFFIMCALCALGIILSVQAHACTGISLQADDGGICYGRTMEWGSFDLESNVTLIPKGTELHALSPEQNAKGMSFRAKYNVMGINAIGKLFLVDGINEKGLAGGLFYHPDFIEYAEYSAKNASSTLSSQDVMNFVLATCQSVAELKEIMAPMKVIAVTEPRIQGPVPAHWMFCDSTGARVVVEIKNGICKFFDAPLGVITNAPTYDWHIINLRNYINLSPVSVPTKKLTELDFSPLGGGSGMHGLPGDFTPPSRFIRAVAWTQSARALHSVTEAEYETFRILDNFNVPLGSAEGTGAKPDIKGMRSSTLWTSCYDLGHRILLYHTQNNRRVRRLKMDGVDFSKLSEITYIPLDSTPEQDILDITP